MPTFGRILHVETGDYGHQKVCSPEIGESREYSNASDESVATGAVTRAPAPKPPTATPVIRPRRSGNHLTSTATGTM